MSVSKRPLRTMPGTAREIAKLCNTLELVTRRLRRSTDKIIVMERQVRAFEAHLVKLRSKYLEEEGEL